MPPSWLSWLLLWKPVAILCSMVAPSSMSPAICSTVKSRKDISLLNASITQSR